MYIKNMELKNYMSFDNASINFQSNKVYIIYGVNKDTGGANGIGKSALLEAIPLSIYGKSLRPGTSPNSVAEFIQKGKNFMELEIELSNNVHIKRKRYKNKEEVELLIDNKPIDIRLKSDINREIEKYTISFSKFSTLNYFNPLTLNFFNLTPTNRFKVLEDILGLNKITELYELYRNKLNDLKMSISQLDVEMNSINDRKADIGRLIQQLEEERKRVPSLEDKLAEYKDTEKIANIINDIKILIKSIVDDIKQYMNLLNALKDIVDDAEKYESLSDMLKDINVQRVKLAEKLLRYEVLLDEVYKLKNNKPKVCPVCKRPFDDNDEHKFNPDEYIKEKTEGKFSNVEQLNDEINQLNSIQIIIETNTERFNDTRDRLKNASMRLANLINQFYMIVEDRIYIEKPDDIITLFTNISDKLLPKLRELNIIDDTFQTKDAQDFIENNNQRILDKIRYEIENKEKEILKLIDLQEEILQELDNKIEELQIQSKKLKEEQEKTQILVDELSVNGGFRVYVYSRYIEKIQSLINRYVKFIYPTFKLSLEIKMKGRDKGINIRIYDNDIEKSYANLSSGERRICDFVFALSLSSFGTNILIIDEALNVISYEIKTRIIDLLINLNKQVFLVEHDKTFVDEIFYSYPDKITPIYVVKENNKSTITN